jgi:hypothetical protein
MGRWQLVAGAAVLGASLGAPRPARADVALGGDFDVGMPIGQTTPSFFATGAGFDLRLGYRFRIPYQPLWIIPEVALGYMDLAAHVVRARPGVRVAFGRFVVPFVYGHLGWGFVSYDPLGAGDPRGTAFVGSNGLAFDAGAGVDFAVLRRLSVGAHLGYAMVGVTGPAPVPPTVLPTGLPTSAKWIDLGLGATFTF